MAQGNFLSQTTHFFPSQNTRGKKQRNEAAYSRAQRCHKLCWPEIHLIQKQHVDISFVKRAKHSEICTSNRIINREVW